MDTTEQLTVMADYLSSGIWVDREERGACMIGHAALGLPEELSQRFNRWNAEWDEKALDETLDDVAFDTEGRALAVALKRFVGESASVDYYYIQSRGDLVPFERIDLT